MLLLTVVKRSIILFSIGAGFEYCFKILFSSLDSIHKRIGSHLDFIQPTFILLMAKPDITETFMSGKLIKLIHSVDHDSYGQTCCRSRSADPSGRDLCWLLSGDLWERPGDLLRLTSGDFLVLSRCGGDSFLFPEITKCVGSMSDDAQLWDE